MAYDEIFTDGFDKYGVTPTPLSLTDWLTIRTPSLVQVLGGEWTLSPGSQSGASLGPPLGGPATGYSARLTLGGSAYLMKPFPIGDCARSIGGFAFYTDNFSNDRYYTFIDTSAGTTHQMYLSIMATTGKIGVYRGAPGSGTLLAMSTEAISINTVTFIEWDITFHNSTGIVKVYLNGVLTSINLSGVDNCSTANNYAGASAFWSTTNSSNNRMLIDHYYQMFFTSGGSGDTALRTNPIVRTDFPATDDATQFEYGYTLMGDFQETTAYNTTTPTQSNTTTTGLYIAKYVAPVSGNLDTVFLQCDLANASVSFVPCVYADSSGAPGALLASGPQVNGIVIGQNSGPLTSPLAVTKGTAYWIGFLANPTSTSNRLYYRYGQVIAAQRTGLTFASGPPNPAGSMTNGAYDYMAFSARIVQNAGDKAFSVTPGLPTWNTAGDKYVYDNTSGQKDLFNTTAMSPIPSLVHVVGMKAFAGKSDGGSMTINLKMKSSATEGNGTKSSIAVPLTASWINSYFPTDPNTAAAWTGANVSASKIGYALV